MQFPVICWDFSVGWIGQDRSLQAEVIFPDFCHFLRREGRFLEGPGVGRLLLALRADGVFAASCLPRPSSSPCPGPWTAWHGARIALSKREVPVWCSPCTPPVIYCVRVLFGAIKLSSNGNMFLFSRICRMKANIFIILPSSPHFVPLH